jgi:hypothetical protein
MVNFGVKALLKAGNSRRETGNTGNWEPLGADAHDQVPSHRNMAAQWPWGTHCRENEKTGAEGAGSAICQSRQVPLTGGGGEFVSAHMR